ncbi:CHAP domain-containing protein [Kineosporia babensis]|uniref:CHAP domain-containing protein n=1 Tax=Kineosporia babensis TaxID=499548 RepID=A0A9X1NPD6_9ACTN|nr:CHAP domain-containing protein [Kineosporia babensis]MCD5317194.1 CHAP domain-containing protein [Kineosporia babensis]
MSSPNQVLSVARSQLGIVEGPRANEVKFNDWYYGRHIYGSSYAWCAVFVSWVAAVAGATAVIPKHAYTPSGAAWFQARGRWGSTPRVGAVVYFRWPGMGRISHVGLVEAVRSDGSIVTIEGNTDAQGSRTGGRVMRKIRRSYIAGYGYPNYDGSTPPVTIPPTPATPAAGRLAVDGDLGPATIARLQQSLNRTGGRPVLTVDGRFGPASKRALQARLNHTNPPVAVDGQIGRQTVRALQRNVGAQVDIVWGPATTKALQSTLNRREL